MVVPRGAPVVKKRDRRRRFCAGSEVRASKRAGRAQRCIRRRRDRRVRDRPSRATARFSFPRPPRDDATRRPASYRRCPSPFQRRSVACPKSETGPRRSSTAGSSHDRLHRRPSRIHDEAIEADVPAGKVVHVILDNYATTSIATSCDGSIGIRASPSTSRPHRFVDQRRRRIFRYTHKAPSQARRIPLDHEPSSRHQSLPRGTQQKAEAVPLEDGSRPRPRR
jgi:hypothetical protein